MEEHCYVPEFKTAPRPVNLQKADPRGQQGGKKGGGKDGRPKTSPWGLTPEEIAAKKSGGKNKAAKPTA